MGEEEEYSPVESPTLVNIRRRDDIWPPKHSSVRHMPRTGFSPTVNEGGQAKRFVWPPPKGGPDSNLNDVGSLPQNRVQDAWNPEANALGNRPPPFAPRTAPSRRCTDDVWPPKDSGFHPSGRPSPRPVNTVGRFENYIKYPRGPTVPVTYRTPPGTAHILYTPLEGEFVHESKTTTTTTTTQQQQQVVKQVHFQQTTQVEEEEEEEEEESEEEESEEE